MFLQNHMKKLLLGLFMFSFFVIGSQVQAATLELTSSNTGNTFQITKGQTLKITIASPGDGGYTFDTPRYDSSILQLTNHQHLNPNVYYGSIVVGNFGSDYWEFLALNSGSTKLEITATRQWIGGDTATLFSSTIIVNSSSSTDYGCYNNEVYSSTTGLYCYRSGNNNPIISGVSGPQSLSLNQTGTWTVNATNPNGGNLTYSVDWGDIVYATTASYQIPQYQQSQSATFTHSYSIAGKYNPTFTVTSDNSIRCFTTPCPTNGGSARTSISVVVGNSYSVDYGCNQGQIYSSTTGQRCPVITTIDTGCAQGNIYSYTTGQRCTLITQVVDSGCLAGNIFSYTTGRSCNNTNQIIISPNRRTLRWGLTGDDVRKLQQFLGITDDGVFGRGTTLYVKNWQIANGLYPDGVFGSLCYQRANFTQ